MHARTIGHEWRILLAGVMVLALGLAEAAGQPPQPPKTVGSVELPPAPPPTVGFVLKDRHGRALPSRTHFARAGGGNVDVALVRDLARDDTIVIAMTGVVTAGPQPCKANSAAIDFDLDQEFEIAFADKKITKAKLSAEAQVIGLLRGDRHGGSAHVGPATIAISCERICLLSLAIGGHGVSGDDFLAINDHKGPINIPVLAGDYHLHQSFHIAADHAPSIPGKAAAAEFAPEPALDPTWISLTDPFHGASKKEFGFRVILHVEPE